MANNTDKVTRRMDVKLLRLLHLCKSAYFDVKLLKIDPEEKTAKNLQFLINYL